MLRRFDVAKVQAFCGLIAFSILFFFGLTPAQAQTDHWLTGYYATYNMSVMTPQQLDYTKLTHVIYWPVIPNTDGTLNEVPFGLSQSSFNSGATALVAGAHAAGAKALIGIGGNQDSGASAGFSGSTTPANLTTFVNNIVALMELYGFDGVDINWEEISSSSSTDDAQFVAFIGALRTKLNTITPRPLLTMAPAVTSPYNLVGTETTQQLIASVASDFDQLNIQTYIMSGPYCGWETWYNAPLNNGGQDFLLDPGTPLPTANNLVASYASAGIPMAKMAIGIQFDAATWTGGAGTSTGGATKPYQTWTDDAANCGDNPSAPNFDTTPYRVMITTLAKQAGYVVEPMDTVADQNWLSYDPSGAGTTNEANDVFVSYDSPQSIAKKGTDLAAQASTVGTLGGVMIFELSGDYAGSGVAATAQHPLLDAANQMANLLPSAVTGLAATPSSTSVTLSWSAAPFASSYQVYQSTTTGVQGSLVGTVTGLTTAISGLTSGTTYYFQVEPGNSFGYSAGGAAKVTTATTGSTQTKPTITWATPAAMTYLQPLSATQLDATANVAGTFAYSPVAGTKLTAGTHTLSVTFTPTNTAAYSTATASVSVIVNKATSVVSWATPAAITAGTALSAAQLDATANVPGLLSNIPGSLVYTPAAGTVPATGTDTLSVAFTPTDTADFTSASATVSLKVNAAVNSSASFGSQAIGAASAEHVFTFSFAKSTVVSSIQVVTMGAAGLDFAKTADTTCTATTYAAGSSCTVAVTFKPVASGQRSGAITGLGNPFYISGTGTGAQIAYDPATPTQTLPPSAITVFTPNSIAVDGAGNLYAAGPVSSGGAATANALYKITPAGVFSAYPSAVADWVAIDGAGDLFYANLNLIREIQPNGTQTAVITLPSTDTVTGLAVDGAGNLFYLINPGGGGVNSFGEYSLSTGATMTTPIATIAGISVTSSCGLGVDGSDNLFVGDCSDDRIVELPAAGTPSVILSGIGSAADFAVGNNGSLYIDKASLGDIYKWNPKTPTAAPTVVVSGAILGSAFAGPIAADSAENLYVGDSSSATQPRILKLNRQAPPTITFVSTEIGHGSAALTVTAENIGNANLTLAGSTTGTNPLISANYVFSPLAAPAGTSCEVGEGTASATIPSLSACTYNVIFKPTAAGPTPGTLVLTDNALNAIGSEQSIILTGIGLPTILPSPATLTATAGQDQIVLNWAAVPYASGYSVYRALASGGAYTKIATPTATTYVDTTTPPGIAYSYVVIGFDSVGNGYESPTATATALVPVPTGFKATAAGAYVNLSWNASPSAQGYEVLRSSVSGGPYNVQIGETTTATTLQDATALPGTTYYYVLQAYVILTNPAAFDGSAFTPQVSATTAPQKLPAPTGLTAYLAQGGGGANITWSGVTGAVSYNIYRSTTSGNLYKMIANYPVTPTGRLSYIDVPLAGGTYYWVVQAINSAGASPSSNQASLTVPNLPIPAVPTFSITVQDGQPEVTANNDGNVLFNFYRSSAAAGPYTEVWTSDIYNFTDQNTVPGGTYYYELTATNNAGTSGFSAPQSVTVPATPSIVKATPGNGQVTLSWTAVPGAKSYTVYYGTVSYNPDTEGGPTSATSLLITGLTNGTPYYFEVQATEADGVSTSAWSAIVSATPAGAQTVTWIPDWQGQLLQVRVGSGTSATAITIALPTCNPNSVAVNQNKAYVACNANGANPDKILVYDATTIRAAAAGTLAISPLQTITSTDFNSLIGIAFDASNDLWVASNGNNEVLEFTAASLATATPTDTVSLVDSPASPVALAFDTDGSLWVTGLYGDGILLNFQPSQFGLGSNANPRYCAVTDPQGGVCISQANLFLEPEGVAVFNGSVWVANNSTTGSNGLGGATPGRQLVNLTYSGGTLAVAGIYGTVVPDTGGTATSPFFCPGGLYGTSTHLWVNDESFGEATPQCGANGDSASKAGGVFSFTPAQLTAKPATQAPAFTNVTGRPGFGGIFVENDQ